MEEVCVVVRVIGLRTALVVGDPNNLFAAVLGGDSRVRYHIAVTILFCLVVLHEFLIDSHGADELSSELDNVRSLVPVQVHALEVDQREAQTNHPPAYACFGVGKEDVCIIGIHFKIQRLVRSIDRIKT